ncbi:MAG: hypothetical protein RTU30_14005 [Candidatus Thorarchaeota archaeon]
MDNSIDIDQLQTARKDWYVKAMSEPIEGCVIATIMLQEGSVRDLVRTRMLPECFRTKLCWSCVHEFGQHDESMDVYVCSLHRRLEEDPLGEQVRLRNVERYSQ